MDDRDLPPLPIPPPSIHSQAPVAESSRRHSHRSKDRYSARDLATLLLMEQSEHRETKRELSRVSELLRLETQRADQAEQKVLEATDRLKSVNEARWTAVRETARLNESLGLYKYQLEKAQQEIDRAQAVFNIVEKERYEAEVQGAKSRTAARRLHEQHKIYLAREEGRRIGLKEGLEAGRLGLPPDDSVYDPSLSGFGDLDLEDYDLYEEALASPDPLEFDTLSPLRNFPADIAPPTSNVRETPDPVPVPPPAAPPVPVPAPAPQPRQEATTLSPLFTPFHDIHPTPVHNEAPTPRHEYYDVPPDNYIPVVQAGAGGLPAIPPPHEFLNQSAMSPSQNGASSSAGAERVIPPSASATARSPRMPSEYRSPSQRAQSIRAESVRRAPSAAGSIRPVQMPTPRTQTNIAGMEQQAQQQRSSQYAGSIRSVRPQAPPHSASSGPIEITIQPPSGPHSHTSETPSMGNNLFGPPPDVPNNANRSFYNGGATTNSNASPMPGSYALPPDHGPTGTQHMYYKDGDNESESTHSSALQTSTPDTLTTPPELRRPHVPTPDNWQGY